jgi:ATP-dependent Clp protease protease subunit
MMNREIFLDDDEESKRKPSKVDQMIDMMLLKQRRVFFSSPVDDQSALDTIRKLWFLEAQEPGKPILLVINSPGGSVDSGFAVWDQIKMMKSPVTTLVTGLAASMGSILSLVAGKGKRFATPHSRIMIHQPSIHGIIRGQATDLEIQAKEILKTRNLIINVYVEATGRKFEDLEKALDRDTWMNAQEAKDYGLIDKIVRSYEEIGF